MIRLPGVAYPQHIPTGPSKPMTLDDVALIFFFIFATVSVLLIIMAHMKFDHDAEDDKRRRNNDQPMPWAPRKPGGRGIEPIDLMRWFEPDNPMIQSRIAVVEQEKVLEPERERVTV